MDGLRWTLLLIGIGLVIGIYCYDRYQRRSRRSGVRHYDDAAADADFNMAPRPDDDGDALADFSELINDDHRGNPDAGRRVDFDPTAAPDTDTDAGNRAAEETLMEAEIGVQPDRADAGGDATGAVADRLVIFYLKSPPGQAFVGSALFEALHATGLTLGSMGIYHDSDSHGRIIFSVANLFEPGTLDIEDVGNFSTRGIALFMQLPLAARDMDEQDAFERMLGKAEILAGRLGGELHDEQHQPLDDDGVARARSILQAV